MISSPLVSADSRFDESNSSGAQNNARDINAPDINAPDIDAREKRANRSFAQHSWLSISIYTIFFFYFTFAYWRSSYLVRDLSNVVLLPGLSLLLYTYWRNYKILQEQQSIGIGRILLYGCSTALIALCIPSFYSSDLYSYMNAGWQQAQYHLNPYSHLLVAAPNFATDRMFTNVWSLVPCPYGFAYAHLCKTVCQLSSGNRELAICLFKALNFAVYLAIGGIIYWGAKKLKSVRPDANLYLWLCNPLVIIHALSHAHNDIIMALFLVSSLLCTLTGPFLLVIPLLVAGILTKYLCLLAVPFVILYIIKNRGWSCALTNTLLGAAALIAISWTYIQEWSAFRWVEMRADFGMNLNSFTALVQQIGFAIEKLIWHQKNAVFDSGLDAVISAIRLTTSASLIVLTLWLLVAAIKKGRNYTIHNCIQFCLIAMIVATSFVSPRFYPWYVLMYFPLALWLPEKNEWRRLAITLSCTQLFAVTFIGHGHINNFLLLTCVPIAISLWRWRKNKQILATGRS